MGNNQKSTTGNSKKQNQFFTIASFGTLTGCAGIAWIVTSVLSGVFKLSQAPTGLIVSIVVAIAAVLVSPKKDYKNYVVAVFNGFLIYLTVVGGTAFTPIVNPNTPDEVSKPSIIKPWIPDKNFVKKTAQQEQALKDLETELDKIDSTIKTTPTLSAPLRSNLTNILKSSKNIILDARRKK